VKEVLLRKRKRRMKEEEEEDDNGLRWGLEQYAMVGVLVITMGRDYL